VNNYIKTIVLSSAFAFLIILPAYLISTAYGLDSNSEGVIRTSYETLCKNLAKVDLSVEPKGNDAYVALYLRSSNSQPVFCEELRFNFKGSKPTKIEGANLFENYVSLENLDNYPNDNSRFSIRSTSQYQLPDIIRFEFRDVVEKSGLSTYDLKANFELIHYTHPEPMIDWFLTLPTELSLDKLIPEAGKVKVSNDFDHIKYFIESKTSSFFAKWKNNLEEDYSVLYLMGLSTLFGIGISGLMELLINRLKSSDKNV
jgi:hypothetical protein